MNPIALLSPSAALGSSTSGAGGQQYNPQQMQNGQTMEARVVEAAGDNRFILDIGSNRILAQSDSVTLSPGQSLQLQVTATTPQLELRIIAPTLQQFLGHSLSFIGQNLDLGPLFQLLQQPPNPAIEMLTPASRQILETFWSLQQKPLSGKEGGEVLRQIVDNMGLQLEAKLGRGVIDEGTRSLKSALLEIVHLFKESERIGKTGKALLAAIESFQLSQLRMDQEKAFILPLPFPFLDQGYLLIDQKQDQETEERERKKQLHFSLHLALTGLGDITVEFLQTDDGLWMRFNCDSQEKADFVSQFGDELRQQLADLPLRELFFSGTADAPGADLIRQLVPSGQSLLNTKV
ncbi:MAG: hypothetical protein K0A99_07705 [Desulfoarculaceae bacterium]|nr:hypothetical protein [Desulfoarculaceae bacterium]